MNCSPLFSHQELLNPKSLREFNHELRRLAFRPISAEALEELKEKHSRRTLVSAINRARFDPRAFSFLVSVFGQPQKEEAMFAHQRSAKSPSYLHTSPVENPSFPSSPQDRSSRPPSPKETSGNCKPARAEAKEYLQKHVYGSKAALCFEEDVTRGNVYTVRLEAADSTGPRQYDWSRGNKISIQLTHEELLIVTAVFFRLLPACEYKNHGEANDKGFSIVDQGGKLFIKVFAGGAKVKAVPVTPEDAFYVAQILLRQMGKNAPWLSGEDLLALLGRVVAPRKLMASQRLLESMNRGNRSLQRSPGQQAH